MKHYVLDENNNKVEAFTKEEVLAVLQQAINDGTLENIVKDAGFINKIKCCVTGGTTRIAYVTQAKYNELKAGNLLQENTEYNIVDDTTAEDIEKALEDLNTNINNVNDRFENYLPVYEYEQDTNYTQEQNVIYYAIKNFKGKSNGNFTSFILKFTKSGSNGNFLVTVYSPASVITIVKAYKLGDSGTYTTVIYSSFSYSGDINAFTIDQVTTDKYTVSTIKDTTSFSDNATGTITTSGTTITTGNGCYLLNITYRINVFNGYSTKNSSALVKWGAGTLRHVMWGSVTSYIIIEIDYNGIVTWSTGGSSEETIEVVNIEYTKIK